MGANKSTELGSNDTEEMVNVLSLMEAANILTSRGAAASVSLADVLSAASVPTVSGSFPTASAIFTTASVVAREMEEEYARENQRLSEQLARDSDIARLHAEEELKMMIKGLDRSNEVIAKHLREYEQAEADLSVREKIELISKLVAREMEEEYARENQRLSEQLARDSDIARLHAEEELKMMIKGLDRSNEVIAKHLREYEQAEADLSSKPLSKKEQREFYMSVLRSHAGWKTKHFRGMTLEQIKEKFILVWKQFEDFMPMSSKEDSKKVKRQGLKIDQRSLKRMKISEGVSEEELKGMMQLVPLEEQFDREDLHQLWTLVKETFSIKQATRDKEKELWVELKRLFEPNFEDQIWTHHQAFMHDPLD
nr:hypothetical protein [Tanacetum cinerariifolium]